MAIGAGCSEYDNGWMQGRRAGEATGYAKGYHDGLGDSSKPKTDDESIALRGYNQAIKDRLAGIGFSQEYQDGSSEWRLGYDQGIVDIDSKADEAYKEGLEEGLTSCKNQSVDALTGDEDMDALLKECLKVLTVKGNDYTQGKGNLDRLNNFTTGAEALGLQPRQVLAVYLYKHLTAVLRYLKEGQVESEPIEGRIVDCINYFLLLGKLIAHEKREESK